LQLSDFWPGNVISEHLSGQNNTIPIDHSTNLLKAGGISGFILPINHCFCLNFLKSNLLTLRVFATISVQPE